MGSRYKNTGVGDGLPCLLADGSSTCGGLSIPPLILLLPLGGVQRRRKPPHRAAFGCLPTLLYLNYNTQFLASGSLDQNFWTQLNPNRPLFAWGILCPGHRLYVDEREVLSDSVLGNKFCLWILDSFTFWNEIFLPWDFLHIKHAFVSRVFMERWKEVVCWIRKFGEINSSGPRGHYSARFFLGVQMGRVDRKSKPSFGVQPSLHSQSDSSFWDYIGLFFGLHFPFLRFAFFCHPSGRDSALLYISGQPRAVFSQTSMNASMNEMQTEEQDNRKAKKSGLQIL